MKKIWKWLRFFVYAAVIVFAVIGIRYTWVWPGAVKYFWWDSLIKEWVKPKPVIAENMIAPDFTLKGLNGREVALSGLRGRPTLLVFWNPFCGPCKEEIPMLEALYKHYKDKGLEILAVADEKEWLVEGFLKNERQISYVILLDPEKKVGSAYGVRGIPQTFMIDKKGKIKNKSIGYDKNERKATETKYRKIIEELLLE